MALPSSYLTTSKNLGAILNSIVGAKAPEKFTTRFLASLGFTSAPDRLVIGVLKALGFLADDGRPTKRYFEYLDQTRSAGVMAQAIQDAYSDLFQVNKEANRMTKVDIVNKLKTLTQGQYSEGVLDKMGMTFVALCSHGDFKAAHTAPASHTGTADHEPGAAVREHANQVEGLRIGGLVYNIELVLPESRDPQVYEALFQALRKHLS